ncbi:hypothetical protein HAX54_012339 [Datura stramonium]|uniref:Uncharacterized protein n=1 Tax=Datura stramonium TaxID=4076 RepID=A0ABS8TKI5_DATST|nr:hypothetical protein [Datura stramonium]
MVEVGSEREKNRENNGGLTSMDSIESRWVFQDEYDSDMDSGDHGTADGDGSTPRNGLGWTLMMTMIMPSSLNAHASQSIA